MAAVEQVPGKRDHHSSQRAPNGCQGQYLGCGEVRDKIPVGFGKVGVSQRGDKVISLLFKQTVLWVSLGAGAGKP